MEHVVFFPAPDGAPAFHRVASLEDAVHLVERLRNVEGVAEVAVHPLGAEVPLAFRAWYRVEVPGATPAAEPSSRPAEAAEQLVPAQGGPVVEPYAEPVPALAEASANGHGDDGVKSLGFFA